MVSGGQLWLSLFFLWKWIPLAQVSDFWWFGFNTI